MTDLYRKYIDKALAEVAPYASEQTGLLHVQEDMPSPAAPAKENFLYALLFLRHKTHESIQKGKELLRRLLFFQNNDPSSDQYGNFPAILTDYPECRNWHLPVFLSLVLTAVQTSFHTVLGEVLTKQICDARQLLLACVQRNRQKYMLRGWEAFAMAVHEGADAAAEAFLKERDLLLPDKCGLALAALSHLPCGGERLIEAALQLWHPKAATYAGPAIDLRQRGAWPATTLLDLFLGQKTALPARPWGCKASLELALITPSDREWPVPKTPLVFEDAYSMHTIGSAAISSCLGSQASVRIVTPTYTMVLLGPITSFSCDGRRCTGTVSGDSQAYVERDRVRLLSDGKRASVFALERGITIDGDLPIRLAFDTKGIQSLSHAGLENRPGQKIKEDLFDWKISLDILRGKKDSEVSFSICVGSPR